MYCIIGEVSPEMGELLLLYVRPQITTSEEPHAIGRVSHGMKYTERVNPPSVRTYEGFVWKGLVARKKVLVFTRCRLGGRGFRLELAWFRRDWIVNWRFCRTRGL